MHVAVNIGTCESSSLAEAEERREIRFFSRGKQVSWGILARNLDRRDAAYGGGNGWVLVDGMGLEIVRRVIKFLR